MKTRVCCAGLAGHDDERDSAPFGPLSQRAHQGWAIHDGHLQVEHKRVGAVLSESRKGLLAVGSGEIRSDGPVHVIEELL